ncbi:hypothetical protein BHE74_00059673 [Ensete ventricosum]|nr:hypothetical protein GW17_00022457 [Ensete ventricosum]RWW35404.1 hypothetical protein BHE74_00059673 [Ensete ventricosum]
MPMHRRAQWLVQSMGGTPQHSSSSTSKGRPPVAAVGREMIARAHAARGQRRIGVSRSWPALLDQWPHHAVWCEWESTRSGCTAVQGECNEDESGGGSNRGATCSEVHGELGGGYRSFRE